MSFMAIKSYVRVVLGGIILLAAVILIVLQWGNNSPFSFYGMNTSVNLAALMIGCVIFGLIFIWLAKQFVQGVKGVNRTRQAKDVRKKLKQADETQKQLKELQTGDK